MAASHSFPSALPAAGSDIKMEAKGYEERVKVYLRVLGDETLSQYPLCVETVARQCVRFTEPVKVQGQRKSAANIGAFPTRDKLMHTPLRRDSTKSVMNEPMSPVAPQDYNFDFVFDANDSLEFVWNYLAIGPTRPACIVSVGKADTLNGLVSFYLRDILRTGNEVALSCESYYGEKVQRYGYSEVVRVEQAQDALEVMNLAEMGKKAKDGITVLTIMRASDCLLQLVDATSPSKLLDLLLLVATNSDSISDLRSAFKSPLFHTLQRTLCRDTHIIVLGNLVPTVPHYSQAGWVTRLLAGAMETKQRSVTWLVAMCLKEQERLETLAAKGSRMLDDCAVRQNEELSALMKERDELKAALKQQTSGENARLSELFAKHRQEIADMRARQLALESQLSDAKTKIFALETDLEQRAKGTATQFHFMMGVTEDDFNAILTENKANKAKIAELDSVIAAFQKCVGRKTVSAEKEVQVGEDLLLCKHPPKLCFTKIAAAFVLGKRGKVDTEEREALAVLAEQLRAANEEIAALRTQPSFSAQNCSSEDDWRQSRALYHLLTEVWIYTDSAVRGMKQQFDRLFALMEVKVAERELKIAKLEQTLDNTARGGESLRVAELEAELRETRGKLATAEGDLRETRNIVREETERMKDEHKKRLAHLSDQCSTHAETVTRLRSELVAKDAELRQSLAQWESEKRDLAEQVAELKDLRKPVANPSKRK